MTAPAPLKHLSYDEWAAEGTRLFGEQSRNWQFRCPGCGQVQTPAEFVAAGLSVEQAVSRAYFSCIGRSVAGRGCDWTLGGLFQLHRTVVEFLGREMRVMEFATPENAPGPDFKPIGKVGK